MALNKPITIASAISIYFPTAVNPSASYTRLTNMFGATFDTFDVVAVGIYPEDIFEAYIQAFDTQVINTEGSIEDTYKTCKECANYIWNLQINDFYTSGGNNVALQYTEKTITSAEIATLGTNPIKIIDAPASNRDYYDIEKAIVEYNFDTTPFSVTAGDRGYISIDNGEQYASFNIESMLTASVNSVYIFSGLHGGIVNTIAAELFGSPSNLQREIKFGMSNNTLITGDGFLKVKVWYYIRRFG